MDPVLRRQTLADTLRRSAERAPSRLGLACGTTRWTYREFHAVSERLAAGLHALGVGSQRSCAEQRRSSAQNYPVIQSETPAPVGPVARPHAPKEKGPPCQKRPFRCREFRT
jgi:non-ribosomal peptide synthetase component E (peptide arylation enzyme)